MPLFVCDAQIFATPKGNNKSKPFFDHVISFSVGDNHIWVRNYQVVLPENKPKNVADMSLVEVGPRFCLNPVKMFAGSFQGMTLYENPAYVSPNTVRMAAHYIPGIKEDGGNQGVIGV